jgi:hypothetical protein
VLSFCSPEYKDRRNEDFVVMDLSQAGKTIGVGASSMDMGGDVL